MSSDGRELGSTTLTGTAGSTLSISVADLRGRGIDLTTVDPNFLVLRESNSGQQLGAYVTRTTTGVLSFEPSTLTRIVWMMNARNGADYVDAAGTQGVLGGFPDDTRYDFVARLTPTNNPTDLNVVDGDTSMIQEAIDLLNQAWMVQGVRYAELTWVGDDPPNPNVLFGGPGFSPTVPADAGFHAGVWFVVNPTYSSLVQHNAACEETVETFFGFDDLFGQDTVNALFGSVYGPSLTPAGADYLRFGALMKASSRDGNPGSGN